MEKMSYPDEIKVFFKEVIHQIKKTLDPEFVLIAGSFGKGSWLYDHGSLISDFEFVFVCVKPWPLKKKKKLLRSLNKQYPFEISLKGYLEKNISKKIISNYAYKNPGYISLDFFDTFQDPNYLYLKNKSPLKLQCSVEEIPVWEAWRLYINRIGDLLDTLYENEHTKVQINYCWLKIFESTADAYCLIDKSYKKNIDERLQIFTEAKLQSDMALSSECKESFTLIKKALEARAAHTLEHFSTELDQKELMAIIKKWLGYFENKLTEAEGFLNNDSLSFELKYLKNKAIQNKYLGFNYIWNSLISNMIRLMNYPKLLKSDLKIYKQTYSWRHIILLSVSSIFKDQNRIDQDQPLSRTIALRIFKQSQMLKMETSSFNKKILVYWKMLR